MIYSRKIKWKLLLSITGNEYQKTLFGTGIKASPGIGQRKTEKRTLFWKMQQLRWNKEIWKGVCNNMASIRERNGKFNVIYSYTNEKGERKQKWEIYETKAEAKRRKKENWALSTYEGNVSLINNYILPIIGDAKLSEINTRFIERYYQSLLKRRAVINPLNKTSRNEFVSSSTVRDVNKLLRNCFEQAVKHCLRNKRKCLRSIAMKYLPAEQRQKSFSIAWV